MMTRSYTTALIGTGQSVENHLEAVRAVGDRVRLVAAVDLNEARVQAICQAHDIPHCYTDVSQMLAEIQPDLVQIITPHHTHVPLTLQALEAGAWVFCEKPLCGSLADFDRLQAAEEATGRFVSTVAQWRFGSAAQHTRRLAQAGVFGRPLLGHCQTLWYRDMDYYGVPWRGRWATEMGGPTMTLGIHLMDLFLWLMGEWEEVVAMAETVERDIEVEDVSLALVRFADGALGSISNSALSPRQESRLRLDFQRATVEVAALYRYTNADWRCTVPEASPQSEVLAHWESLDSDLRGTHGVQLLDLLDSMERNERPLVSGAEARRVIEFVASLYKSSFTHAPVRRGTIDAADPFYYAMNGQPGKQGTS